MLRIKTEALKHDLHLLEAPIRHLGTENNLKIIQKVFEKLDKEGKGYVTLNDIKYGFNPDECPKVRTGVIGKNEALADLIDLVEYHFNLLRDNNDCQYDGKGTETAVCNKKTRLSFII